MVCDSQCVCVSDSQCSVTASVGVYVWQSVLCCSNSPSNFDGQMSVYRLLRLTHLVSDDITANE